MNNILFTITITKDHLSLLGYLSFLFIMTFAVYFFFGIRKKRAALNTIISQHLELYVQLTKQRESLTIELQDIKKETQQELIKLKQIVATFHRNQNVN
jgi:hypothetical protein